MTPKVSMKKMEKEVREGTQEEEGGKERKKERRRKGEKRGKEEKEEGEEERKVEKVTPNWGFYICKRTAINVNI